MLRKRGPSDWKYTFKILLKVYISKNTPKEAFHRETFNIKHLLNGFCNFDFFLLRLITLANIHVGFGYLFERLKSKTQHFESVSPFDDDRFSNAL